MTLTCIDSIEIQFQFFDFLEEIKEITSNIHYYKHAALVTLEEAVEPLLFLIPQIEDMVKLVKEKCQQPTDNLSIDESAAIMLYTLEWIPQKDSFYYIFNRTINSNVYDALPPWYLYLKLISTALSKLPKSTSQIFYQAINSKLHDDCLLNGKYFLYEFRTCFSSMQFLHKEGFNFDKSHGYTLFIIYSDNGKNISQHSFYASEHEILFPHGQEYEIISHYKSKDKFDLIILKDVSFIKPRITNVSTIVNNRNLEMFYSLHLKQMKCTENYSEISLKNRNITDDHIELITSLFIKNEKYTWLSLENNQITSQDLRILANGLKTNESLESLYLSYNFINDAGVKYLASALAYTYSNLTLLRLNNNSISDKGVKYLAKMLKINKVLTDLWLSNNEISDQGVKLLVNVLQSNNQSVRQLYLFGNKLITDYSLQPFVLMLQSNRVLNTLCLGECSLSKAGQKTLNDSVGKKENFNLVV